MLSKVGVGNINDDLEKLLNARFIYESDENYPKDALHRNAENKPTMKRNEAVLDYLPIGFYTVVDNNKIPDNGEYPLALIQAG